MIRVTLEIIPRGNEAKKFTAGVLEITNDGTGTPGNGVGVGNYDLHITGPVQDGDCAIPNEFWGKGRLEGFKRKRGWWSCVKEALARLATDYDEPETEERK